MVRHTKKQKAPGGGWYAHSLLIKNNQEKHALNSKTIQKKRKWKNEKNKTNENRWKIQIYYSLDELLPGQKSIFLFFFCLSSCSVATALLRIQVSWTEGDCWRDDEKQSHKDLQPRQKHGSIYATSRTRIHTHTPTHTHLSGLTHTYPALVCRQLQT